MYPLQVKLGASVPCRPSRAANNLVFCFLVTGLGVCVVRFLLMLWGIPVTLVLGSLFVFFFCGYASVGVYLVFFLPLCVVVFFWWDGGVFLCVVGVPEGFPLGVLPFVSVCGFAVCGCELWLFFRVYLYQSGSCFGGGGGGVWTVLVRGVWDGFAGFLSGVSGFP